jgi:hypothetical protein
MRIHTGWALLLVLGISIPATATTVVVTVTPLGIVMGTDSKYVRTARNISPVGEGVTDKAVIIQNHIAVASLGQADILVGSVHYNFLDWIADIQSRLSKEVSVDEFASVIETESTAAFGTFHVVLEHGSMVQKDELQSCEPFIQYVVAGFQDNKPKIYVISWEIDWIAKNLVGPKKILLSDRSVGNVQFYAFGVEEALKDTLNPGSFAYKQALADSPDEFTALLAKRAVTLDGSIALARTFIRIEEKTNPGDVGGDVRLIRILPNGTANRVADKTVPKARSADHTQNSPKQE